MSRGAIFWGAAFIAAGATVLLIQQGYVDEQLLGNAGQWWPLLLIGAGVAVIFAGALGALATGLAGILLGVLVGGFLGGAASFPTSCGTGDPPALRALEDGSFDGAADIEIELNCATLDVAAAEGDAWTVEADDETADILEVAADATELDIRANEDVVLSQDHPLRVGVTLPGGEGSNLATSLNAGDARFDLRDARWGSITIGGNAVSIEVDLSGAEAERVEASLNAGSVTLQVDEDSLIGSIQLSGNAGSFDVCATHSVGLEITVGENVATGHNLDEAGLIEDGGVWRTPDFEDADTQLEISFSGNAASFTVNPEGGCS